MKLTLDLADGFVREHVIVTIAGREILNAQDVSTRAREGRALRLTHVSEAPQIHVTIALPRRAARLERSVQHDSYLRVNVDHYGTLHLIEQPGGS
jgi:hypothetical protein